MLKQIDFRLTSCLRMEFDEKQEVDIFGVSNGYQRMIRPRRAADNGVRAGATRGRNRMAQRSR